MPRSTVAMKFDPLSEKELILKWNGGTDRSRTLSSQFLKKFGRDNIKANQTGIVPANVKENTMFQIISGISHRPCVLPAG